MSPPTVTLLTDYGPGSEHVGALHAVLATRCPGADRIDLAHDIPPGDVRWGAILLARLAPLAPAGAVHLAVVDPGVGGPRRAVAVALDDGGAAVGPDNGLLGLLAAGRARDAVALDPGLVAEGPVAPTFHGRDLFAPAAARLAAGAPLESLGAPIEPHTLEAPDLPGATAGAGTLEATVAGVDSFGNLTLLARPADLDAAGLAAGRHVRVVAPGVEERAIVGRRFGDAPEGALVCFVDSWGMVALAVNLGDAAERLGARPGDRLRLEPA